MTCGHYDSRGARRYAYDPSEKMDRSKQQPEVFKKLQAKLAELANEAVKANIAPNRAPADFKVPKVWGQNE